MADDKIVTKKTAAKKPEVKKPTAKKGAVTSEPSAAPAKLKAATGKSEPAAATALKKAASASKPKEAAAKKPPASPAEATSGREDRQVSLKQLANANSRERLAMIREAAYYKAEKRNFAPGHDAEDWAAAERDIDELLSRARTMTGAN